MREAIQAALASLAEPSTEKLRVVRIADTLNLERFLVSESCAKGINGRPGVTTNGSASDMQFDASGNLMPL
jgi:hypothetical protein